MAMLLPSCEVDELIQILKIAYVMLGAGTIALITAVAVPEILDGGFPEMRRQVMEKLQNQKSNKDLQGENDRLFNYCNLRVLALAGWTMFKGGTAYTPSESNTDFYSLSRKTIEGNDYDFNQLKGKRVLIVNTASECGFTPQYKGLQKLHEQYGESLTIIGFPCNDFGNQESGSSEEINSFCSKNYGVSFQMMEKVSIKGDAPHPVYFGF